jgi:hypothetical protein
MKARAKAKVRDVEAGVIWAAVTATALVLGIVGVVLIWKS